MSVRQRGCLTFIVMLFLGIIGCVLLPFIVMPNAGIAVALPLIEVPGEVVVPGGLFGIDLTNTFIGTLLADLWVLIFVFFAWRASRGWTKEIPGRFQSWVEWFLGDIFYNFMKGIGGKHLRTAPLLWPLVATIFLLLLAGNWLKLLPGVETVGTAHCSHINTIGYPLQEGAVDGSYLLYVDRPLSSGERQTPENEEACHEFFAAKEWTRYPAESAEEIEAQIADAEVQAQDAELVLSNLQAELPEADLSEEQQTELDEATERVTTTAHEVERQEIRLQYAQALPDLERQLEDVRFQITQLEEAADAESEASHDETAVTATASEEVDTEAVLADLRNQEEDLQQQVNVAQTQVQFPTAALAFSAEELESGAFPFLFHITPFIRGMSTDLSLTFMLAIMAIVAVQIYGVWALGPAYFEKFINITALGNLGKKPMGAVDFLVGLIEIISEIGKIVSLAFRLFGNLFAGGVALIALTFLVAFFIPMVMYLLEIIIGTVQALVFAVLTLVFAVQAMEAHHGDEEHEHAAEGQH
ncbi:MAG: F0F1 ATP synthase subunit A [Anaerolineae bacterium]|nr:F0F1 ATP synthase subunit A [Anaerolineae bacterium]